MEHIAAPIAELIFPPAAGILGEVDGLVTKLQTAIATAEANGPLAGGGQAKNTAVVADFEAGLAVLQTVLTDTGHTVTYDPAALQAAIDAGVAFYNAAATLKSSIKLAKVSTAAPAPAKTP
jgi:hypothetical protein